MQNDSIWWLFAGAIAGGYLVPWVVESLFARWCHHTGVDRHKGATWGVIGWATLAAYWCLLPGAFLVAANAANPKAWLILAPGLAVTLFVVLRFRRYWRRSRRRSGRAGPV